MALYGVYRGVIADNVDPGAVGRVKVCIECQTLWALSTFTTPNVQVGFAVIVAFEAGDRDRPVILGENYLTIN